MEMSGEYRIEAPRERVWAALNDPEVLKRSIPGCEELEKVSETQYAAKVRAKVGPVSARFAGTVHLSDIDAPRAYRISGEGKGGTAGFAKGGANVRLEADGAATLLRYEVDAQVGGKLAQIGSRLVDGTARKLAKEFFDNFSKQVSAPAAAPAEPAEAEPAPAPVEPAPAPPTAGLPPAVWVAGLIAIVLILLAIFAL